MPDPIAVTALAISCVCLTAAWALLWYRAGYRAGLAYEPPKIYVPVATQEELIDAWEERQQRRTLDAIERVAHSQAERPAIRITSPGPVMRRRQGAPNTHIVTDGAGAGEVLDLPDASWDVISIDDDPTEIL